MLDLNTKKTNIEMKYIPQIEFDNYSADTNLITKNVGKSGNILRRSGGINGQNDRFISSILPASRGCTTFRARLEENGKEIVF